MSSVLHYRYKGDGTTVAGVLSGNTESMVGTLCRQLYIKSASSGTTYTVNVTDKDDVVIHTGAVTSTGIYNSVTPFPVEGVVTIAIAAASADEAFTILAVFSDK